MDALNLTITENTAVTANVSRMTLTGENLPEMKPGQFINIRLPGLFLRRPVSVYDSEPGRVTIIYKAVGTGTRQMTGLLPGTQLDVLTGLGSGYDLRRSGTDPLLVGGGVGVPPLYFLAKKLREQGNNVTVLLGFNTAGEVFGETEFLQLGCDVRVITMDGSCGLAGVVTDHLPDVYTFFYTCGPMPMLRAVYHAAASDGQFSFEERMGCGFGACMGCTQKTKNGYKRICREGPVLDKEEILWED